MIPLLVLFALFWLSAILCALGVVSEWVLFACNVALVMWGLWVMTRDDEPRPIVFVRRKHGKRDH